jgi:proton glutamate symport protein
MAAGIVLGLAAPRGRELSPVSNIFSSDQVDHRPLIFGTLVYGIAGSGSVKRWAASGWRRLFEIVTTAALFLGLAAVNLTAGRGMTGRTAAETAIPQTKTTLAACWNTFPQALSMPWPAAVLQIVVFAFCSARRVAVGAKARP